MRPSPLLSAAAGVALLAAVAGPATAADPVPARGVAGSSVTLLSVAAGGHTLSAGTLELLSNMLGAEAVAQILLTPLTADGIKYGQQTVTPASSPGTAPALSTGALPGALDGVAALTSPVLTAESSSANGEPKTSAGADSLGGLTLLGLPLAIDGALEVSSAVSKTTGALSDKTVTIENVALPSIADLLAALGLDLSALPIEVLTELLTELDLVNTAVTTANQALEDATAAIQTQIDAAQAQVDAAEAALAAEVAKLAGPESDLAAAEDELAAATAALAPLQDAKAAAQSTLGSANGQLTAATTALNDALAGAGLASLAAYNALPAPAKAVLAPVIDPLVLAVTAAQTAVTNATTALTAATTALSAAEGVVDVAQAAVDLLEAAVDLIQDLIDAAQAVLDAAIAALQDVLTGIQTELDALLGAITAVLDGTPLVSFDSLSVVTKAAATSNKEGGQTAQITGGEIAGLEVLGTDVLSDVLGTSSVDLLDLLDTQLAGVNTLIAELSGVLSGVLSGIDGFPTLSIPAPAIGLLTKSTSTGIENGFGVADTSVKGLSITLPAVSIPSALALPDALDLPAFTGVDQVAGLLTSAPVRLDLATMSSNAAFAPAVTAAPGTVTPGTGTPGTGTPGTGTPGTGTPTTPTSGVPQLPRTGASQALAVLGFALMAGAIVARRRSGDLTEELVG